MGYPGKNHKSYQTPKRPFEKTRIEEETRLVIEYGLRNKREVWKAQSHLRKYRKAARELLALMSSSKDAAIFEAKKTELISHMQRAGLLGPDADIDNVLALKVPSHLERRLQTIVYRKGLARSPKQARQTRYPRSHCDCRTACHHSGIPCNPWRRNRDLLLRDLLRSLMQPIQKGQG